MSQLSKKCFIGSCVTHGLLLFVLVVAPAFLTSKQPPEPMPLVLTLLNVTDAQTRGGTPVEEPPPAPPPQVKPVEPVVDTPPPPIVTPRPEPPEPKSAPKVEPKIEKPEPVQKVPDDLTPKTKPTPKPKPKVEIKPVEKPVEKPVVKKTEPKPAPKVDLSKIVSNNTEAQRRAREKAEKEKADREAAIAAANFKKQAMARLAGSISSIKENTSSTIVEMAGGSGGEVYVNYTTLVKAAYNNAWIPPDEVANNAIEVRAKVMIDRSGNVIRANPIRKSGNAALDKSVDRALKLKFIAPFPEGSKDAQREFIIIFDLKARRSLG